MLITRKLSPRRIDLNNILNSNPFLVTSSGHCTTNYVTIFDSNFMPQGLCLYYSLAKHSGDFSLWVLCVDEIAFATLEKLKLPRLTLLNLASLETPDLLKVKPLRTSQEYCWTLTPFAPRFVFEADPRIEYVTYIDADMFLLRSPLTIFNEFYDSGKSTLITDHFYAPDYDESVVFGKYCVQFMIFQREKSEKIRLWWEEKCIEWCYAISDENRFGDQKYVEQFQDLFPDEVHVLRNSNALIAPWNAIAIAHSQAIAFHFQGFRILNEYGSKFLAYKGYVIPNPTYQSVYLQYIRLIHEVMRFHSICIIPLTNDNIFVWYIGVFFRWAKGTYVPGLLRRVTVKIV